MPKSPSAQSTEELRASLDAVAQRFREAETEAQLEAADKLRDDRSEEFRLAKELHEAAKEVDWQRRGAYRRLGLNPHTP